MKKFFKFLFGTFSVIAAACGVIFLYKSVIKKDDSLDDLDDEFEDDFEDFETEKEGNASESREYVPINLGSNEESEEDAEDTAAPAKDSIDEEDNVQITNLEEDEAELSVDSDEE